MAEAIKFTDVDVNTTEKYRRRLKQLKNDRQSWGVHWKDIVDFMMPRRGRYLSSDTEKSNDGAKKHGSIVNGSASDALRTIAAGLQGGLTSPSRPWFAISINDEQIMELAQVREWCHDTRNLMLEVLAKSNFYGAIHSVYEELAGFGTSGMLIEEDLKKVIRCRPFTIGEYYLALDNHFEVAALYRQFAMTARQLVEEFGIDNVTEAVKNSLQSSQGEKTYEVVHVIEKNDGLTPGKADQRGMEFSSIYFEVQADTDKFLRQKGYKSKPFVAPRWYVNGVDTYGASPGMDALGDVKMLQKMETKKLKALDKMVDPPMNAPSNMKGKGGTVIAGGVNYVDIAQGQQGFTPAYQINPDFQKISIEIDRVEQRIKRFFFNDLFLAIINTDKQATAYEISKKYEEKMVVLGPILERLQSELLGPVIERVYAIVEELGILPIAPQELQGREIKIEFIGLLAQAQKLVGTTGIEQVAGFVANMAALSPSAIDKFDADEAIDQYADMVGIPPKLIRSDDVVAQIRDGKAKMQAQAQAQMQQASNIQNAKTLSETPVGTDSMLDVLGKTMKGMGPK